MIVPFDNVQDHTREEVLAGYKKIGFDDKTAETYTAIALGEVDLNDQTAVTKSYDTADRDAMAKTGEALPDGSFPIKNASDLESAIRLSGRGNEPEQKIKDHIIARAKALDLTDKLPAGWTVQKSLLGTFQSDAAYRIAADYPESGVAEQINKAILAGADEVTLELGDDDDNLYVSWKSPEFTPVAKAVDEERFTFAPVYIPGQYDSDGDWSDPDTIQKAVWNFARGDRLIAAQHHPELGAMGEAVELAVIPFEHDVEMHKSDGTSYAQHFPAGTPWMGVVWNENVWPLIKAGKMNGYSIGGNATMLDVALPEDEVAKSLKAPKVYDVDLGDD